MTRDSLKQKTGFELIMAVIAALMIFGTAVNVHAVIPTAERDALIDLYNSTDGASWGNKAGWLGAAGTECSWQGVTCDPGETHVRIVELPGNNLKGPIPASIGDLTDMDTLYLQSNDLSGSIPPEIGGLTNLQNLYLYGNDLTGSIPSEMGGLASLRYLRLDSNQLTGSIPPELGDLINLRELYLSSNRLTEGIPAELGNLINLQKLYLNSNSQLGGSIPPELGSLTNLQYLYLNSSQLTGNIPPELGNLTNLRYLQLSSNQLTGSIPSELGSLTSLLQFYLNNNQLTGSIPPELGSLMNLMYLHLYSNQLSGNIPAELGGLTNLQYLYLYSNQLTGSIPSELGNLTKLVYLRLDDNQLIGEIPSELGGITNLQHLYLYSNQLTGSIPSDLSSTNLRYLYLQDNQLTGDIPAQLPLRLYRLYLHNNQLTGNISGIGSLVDLQQLYLQNNHFDGNIPSTFGNLVKLTNLYLQGNKLLGSIPTELTQLVNLTNSGSSFQWNALYTTDDTLRTFLNTKQTGGDWESTQTIAPADLTAGQSTSTSIPLTWTKILYSDGSGGYEVEYSTPSNESYTLYQTTADKTVESTSVNGLTPNTATYYLRVRTVTEPHENNANTVHSEYTDEIDVNPPPVITQISPTHGPVPGGTVITITGMNFDDDATITFGGLDATDITVTSEEIEEITCTPPEHAAGSVEVVVTNPDGQSGSYSSYTYDPPPSITPPITPAGGPASGNTTVTITGTGFVSGATVTFGNVTATNVNVSSAITLICKTPANEVDTVDVVVTNPDGQASAPCGNCYTYVQSAPVITGISPDNGPDSGKTLITISGNHFLAGATVTFGGVDAVNIIVSAGATEIRCYAPAHTAGPVDVVVTNPDGKFGTHCCYTFNPSPVITPPISPNHGPASGSTQITITGEHFATGATVTFDGEAASNVSVVSSTKITCKSPAHAPVPVDVMVTNPDGQSGNCPNCYTYDPPAPTITQITPARGPASIKTEIIITGKNFVNRPTVKFGGILASNIRFVSSEMLTCTSPIYATETTSSVNVVLTNPDGKTDTGTYTYNPRPIITPPITPDSGPASGNKEITITGKNFVIGVEVKLDGARANITRTTDAEIVCIPPKHAPGPVSVVVVNNPDGQLDTCNDCYTYNPRPSIAEITPNNGSPSGNTDVKITGTNFVSGATVTFGGKTVTDIVIASTMITCKTPANDPDTQVDVVVTNPDGQADNCPACYSYGSPPCNITSITPDSGPTIGGTKVEITGNGFELGVRVFFGGSEAENVKLNIGEISCETTSHAGGIVDVQVINPDGQSCTSSNGYTYEVVPPLETGALLDLYDIIDGDTNWTGEPGTVCDWDVLTCEDGHVTALDLSDSNLNGKIPVTITDLSHLRSLDLSNNRLTGTIPEEIAELSSLESLDLHGNMLTGPVPESLKNLTTLKDGLSDFRWNALYTSNLALDSFLSSKQKGGNWKNTQTVAPTNFIAVTDKITTTSVSLKWNLIDYRTDGGGYTIEYATVSGGPYQTLTIDAKTTGAADITALEPGVTYFIRIRAKTDPHTDNNSTVYSNYSDEITVSTISLTAEITLPMSDESILAGESLQFEGTVTNGTPSFQYSWDFDGGAADSVQKNPGEVIFQNEGKYTVTFTVTDEAEDTTSDSITVMVMDSDPQPKPLIDSVKQNICKGDSVYLIFGLPVYGGPFTVIYTDGNENYTQSNLFHGDKIKVTPDTTTTYSLRSVTDAQEYTYSYLDSSVTIYITPETSGIYGSPRVGPGARKYYFVKNTPGSTYQWTVVGGTIVSDNGAYGVTTTIEADPDFTAKTKAFFDSGEEVNKIMVNWGPNGGAVYVTETNESGCQGTSSLNVSSFYAFDSGVNSGQLCGKVEIDGQPAESGDWIAAFDESGNCVGINPLIAMEEAAHVVLNIYGDDPGTDEKEGLTSNEEFTLQLYDASKKVYLESGASFTNWQPTMGTCIPAYDDNRTYNFNSSRRADRSHDAKEPRYDSEGIPERFKFDTHGPKAGMFRGQAQIDGDMSPEPGDWVAAFDEDGICVGTNELIFVENIAYILLTIHGPVETFTLQLYDVSTDTYLDCECEEPGCLCAVPECDCDDSDLQCGCDVVGCVSRVFDQWEDTKGMPIPAYEDITKVYMFRTDSIELSEIQLDADWNLISFDVVPKNNNPEHIFYPLIANDNLLYVEGYENGPLLYEPEGPPWMNTLSDIEKGYGYWVRTRREATLELPGFPVDPDFRPPLCEEWNLVMYNGDEPQSPIDYFKGDSALYVSGYDKGYVVCDIKLPFLCTTMKLKNGFGYWVQMEASGNCGDDDDDDDDDDEPVPTLSSGLFYGQITVDGRPAEPSDWVVAYDSKGNCAGVSSVIIDGGRAYLNLTIYGDDPISKNVDEGIDNEFFTLRLYDASEGRHIVLCEKFTGWMDTNGRPIPGYDDINVIYDFSPPRPGDSVLTGEISIENSILILKLISGIRLDAVCPEADLNGDQKVGLEDAIYILQAIANAKTR